MKSMLGSWLEDKRLSLGMTKGQMSEKIGIVVGQYSAYINGKSTPRQTTLSKISTTFSIPVEELKSMLDAPAAAAPAIAEEIQEAPKAAEDTNIQALLAAAQGKVLEGKLDLIVAMLTDISNRLPK